MPLASLAASKASAKAAARSDDESDDDVPLASLAKANAAKKAAAKKAKAKKPAAKKKAAPKGKGKAAAGAGSSSGNGKGKAAAKPTKRASSGSSAPAKRSKTSGGGGGSAASKAAVPGNPLPNVLVKGESDTPVKEQIVEFVLQRWQYCIDYKVEAEEPPKDYMALKGFPGVSVGVYGDAIGAIDDRRPKPAVRPTQNALLALPTERLVEMWKTAIEKQQEALIEAEGEGAFQLKFLAKERAMANGVSAGAADKQWEAERKRRAKR